MTGVILDEVKLLLTKDGQSWAEKHRPMCTGKGAVSEAPGAQNRGLGPARPSPRQAAFH